MFANKWVWVALFGSLAFFLLVQSFSGGDESIRGAQISYTKFKSLVAAGRVDRITIRESEIGAKLNQEIEIQPNNFVGIVSTRVPPFGDSGLIKELEGHGIDVVVLPEKGENWFLSLLPWLIFLGVYIFIWSRMRRSMMGGLGGGYQDFLSTGDKVQVEEGPRVTFDDVAGQDNAKREVAETVEFLKDPEPFRRLGATPPRGILLMGPPGTGKTLLARALAGEAGVPFFNISASEFIEMFVGVGASRVRSMFSEAKKRAPCIIFIDELDAIGRVRGAGFGGGHDEREQTLNQILSEMDGFEGHEEVVVLAATNRPDVLDPALLRPGRFDRHVTLDLPDKAAREAILKVHVRDKPLGEDVDLSKIAMGTPGFSGADLKNLVNEAAIDCVREGGKKITMHHFDEMRDRILLGMERTLIITPEEKHLLAVHEAGHTALAYYLPHADPLYKVTIIPRGQSLGVTHMLPEEERHTLPSEYLQERLAVMLGGRASEQVFLNDVSSGGDDDIRQATKLARAMVARWGMSEDVGPVDLRQSDEHPFLGREMASPREFSDDTAHDVDLAVRDLLQDAEARAVDVISQNRETILALIQALEEKESLDKGEIEGLLGNVTEPDQNIHLISES